MFSLLFRYSDAILSPKIMMSQLFLITTILGLPPKICVYWDQNICTP